MKKIIYSVLEKGKNHNKQKSKYHLPIYIPKEIVDISRGKTKVVIGIYTWVTI